MNEPKPNNNVDLIGSNNPYQLLAKYLEDLQNQFLVEDMPDYKDLVNFSTNRSEPFHNWFYYKEGYSSKLVNKLLEEFQYKEEQNLLDPFSGSGTTLFTGKKLNLNTFGFDVSPISTFIAESKMQNYEESDIKLLDDIILNLKINKLEETAEKPGLSIIDKIFNEKQLMDLLKLKKYIEKFADKKAYYPLKVAYLSIIELVSNMRKDGNGIKYVKSPKPGDVEEEFLKSIRNILSDLRQNKELFSFKNTTNKIYHDTFINSSSPDYISGEKIDHIITSPPYANCFDYCAVYKMELWMGDFVKEYKDFRTLRNMAIRSHVNGSVNPKMEHEYELINWITNEIDRFDLWDNKIPRMIRGYFDDMTLVLKNFYNLLNDNGNVAIVVGNSAYKGFIVPTDLMLANIANQLGFKVDKIGVCRKVNSSSPEMKKQPELLKYMRESIIFLRK
ncbi:hypothetical protein GCM10011351_28320 [Paraliobacillus quinghaiensis]|uniref:site-specific DNA-methyltransferase (cytosine-N(4)-specific) n=1 Tax=Paraliobacillus quinghaiensis TaxID=470815 RepID=A0A917TWC0_9BACI|nr:DNA methyltransferase [Paraliobacillus quinghaiensis]GGM40491.1 hypothetical protein GCM10011351_28320 [Paraliobacillus quinghaiensis]